jgi:hypothetical protein
LDPSIFDKKCALTFRPVNTMLYSAKEKADLANLVRIHIAYNITYAQQRNAEGQVAKLFSLLFLLLIWSIDKLQYTNYLKIT